MLTSRGGVQRRGGQQGASRMAEHFWPGVCRVAAATSQRQLAQTGEGERTQ